MLRGHKFYSVKYLSKNSGLVDEGWFSNVLDFNKDGYVYIPWLKKYVVYLYLSELIRKWTLYRTNGVLVEDVICQLWSPVNNKVD